MYEGGAVSATAGLNNLKPCALREVWFIDTNGGVGGGGGQLGLCGERVW